MDMVVASMFETPLLVDTLPAFAALNEELTAAIRARRQQDPAGMARSNRFGWHSDIAMFDWGGPAYRTLIDHVLMLANAYSHDLQEPATPRYSWSTAGWANISAHGSSNQIHCHAGAFWSAIYDVDDGYGGSSDPALGGQLEIEDPRLPMILMEEPDLRFRPRPDWPVPEHEHSIRPATGALLMFPGWLRHGVRPYLGSNERISIAINLTASPTPP